jgi:hypothetical protein
MNAKNIDELAIGSDGNDALQAGSTSTATSTRAAGDETTLRYERRLRKHLLDTIQAQAQR